MTLAKIIFVAVALGLLPGWIAIFRRHHNAMAIFVCGLVGALVWPMWFVALVWAFTATNEKTRRSGL